MKQIVEILKSILGTILEFLLARRTVAIRLVFSAAYGIVGALVAFAVLILAAMQLAAALLTLRPLAAITSLSHVLTVYLYKVFRFVTMNQTAPPWPLGPFPAELETAEVVELTNPGSRKQNDSEAGFYAGPETAEATPAGEAESGEDDTREAIILGHEE